MKRYIFVLSYICMIYLSIEGVSYLGLIFLDKALDIHFSPADSINEEQREILRSMLDGELQYMDYSPDLGWTIKKNGEYLTDCNKKLYKSNSLGIRSDREYALQPPAGVFRIAAFGDSYTHGADVSNDETWPSVMEKLDTNLEVLNFGVLGYGLDQALLRYQNEGAQYKPHVVLIGFMSTDIYRDVNNFRPFYNEDTNIPLAKPRFMIKNGELVLVPNPMSGLGDYGKLLDNPSDILPTIGANDYYYPKRYPSGGFDFSPMMRLLRMLAGKLGIGGSHTSGIVTDGYYDISSEAYRVTLKIFDAFYSEALKNNSVPVIVIFPKDKDIIAYNEERIKVYAPLLSYFDSMNYRYIDMMDAFAGVDVRKINNDYCTTLSQHYSPLANKLAAESIRKYLTGNGIMR